MCRLPKLCISIVRGNLIPNLRSYAVCLVSTLTLQPNLRRAYRRLKVFSSCICYTKTTLWNEVCESVVCQPRQTTEPIGLVLFSNKSGQLMVIFPFRNVTQFQDGVPSSDVNQCTTHTERFKTFQYSRNIIFHRDSCPKRHFLGLGVRLVS